MLLFTKSFHISNKEELFFQKSMMDSLIKGHDSFGKGCNLAERQVLANYIRLLRQMTMQISDVLGIVNEKDFVKCALAVFQFQAEHNQVYAKYLKLLGVDATTVARIEDIPFLPVELFKTETIISPLPNVNQQLV